MAANAKPVVGTTPHFSETKPIDREKDVAEALITDRGNVADQNSLVFQSLVDRPELIPSNLIDYNPPLFTRVVLERRRMLREHASRMFEDFWGLHKEGNTKSEEFKGRTNESGS